MPRKMKSSGFSPPLETRNDYEIQSYNHYWPNDHMYQHQPQQMMMMTTTTTTTMAKPEGYHYRTQQPPPPHRPSEYRFNPSRQDNEVVERGPGCHQIMETHSPPRSVKKNDKAILSSSPPPQPRVNLSKEQEAMKTEQPHRVSPWGKELKRAQAQKSIRTIATGTVAPKPPKAVTTTAAKPNPKMATAAATKSKPKKAAATTAKKPKRTIAVTTKKKKAEKVGAKKEDLNSPRFDSLTSQATTNDAEADTKPKPQKSQTRVAAAKRSQKSQTRKVEKTKPNPPPASEQEEKIGEQIVRQTRPVRLLRKRTPKQLSNVSSSSDDDNSDDNDSDDNDSDDHGSQQSNNSGKNITFPFTWNDKKHGLLKMPKYDYENLTYWPQEGSEVRKLHANDVIFGRGATFASYPGNQQFRNIIWSFRKVYSTTKNSEKTLIARKVLARVASLNPPGRFLVPLLSKNGKSIFEISSKERAIEKACQALREKKSKKPKLTIEVKGLALKISTKK